MKAHRARRSTLVLVLVLMACGLAAWRFGAGSRQAREHAGAARAAPTAVTEAADGSVQGDDVAPHATAAPLPDRAAMAKRNVPADCIGGDMRRANRLMAALDPAHSAEDAFAHALLSQIYQDGDGRDPDAERRATSRIQTGWQAASRRWPRSRDIAWQAARNCAAAYGCDEEAAERHLLDLDAGNAAAWLLAMEGAARRRQHERYDAYLAHAAASQRYAPPAGAMYRALEPLFAVSPTPLHCMSLRGIERRAARLGHLPTADDLAAESAALMEGALNTFDPSRALGGCRSNFGLPIRSSRADCAAVLAMVAEGATIGERRFGLELLIPLLGDSKDGPAYRERYRQLLYLDSVVRAAGEPDVESNAKLLFDDFEAWRRIAVAQHRWPPSRGWLPDWPPQRVLVQQGKFVFP
ncbi:MAG: hypothetical protein ACTHOC_02530 [Luteimonas sp.]